MTLDRPYTARACRLVPVDLPLRASRGFDRDRFATEAVGSSFADARSSFCAQAAVIAETLREGGAKQRRRQKNLKSRDSVLTRFSKSLIVPPAIRLPHISSPTT
jgi:hypothetical protein